ncbi:MAG TPA: twin-arginine translocation signal domain-containing protein [Thermogutta sp.]|nr:twin-arginine translocation signal domain-containing protein [Thermogutta sp.]HPZ84640.1 twin-arginine translocation signal domain-containing protein [Thermogutta sp.]HQF15342.1 twin-arginine translocation signal domain-containing protein [Thermogutta sp.]
MGRFKATRRDLLKGSIGAAAAVFVPHVWVTPFSWAESPNERLNIAAIGVGGRGSDIGR